MGSGQGGPAVPLSGWRDTGFLHRPGWHHVSEQIRRLEQAHLGHICRPTAPTCRVGASSIFSQTDDTAVLRIRVPTLPVCGMSVEKPS